MSGVEESIKGSAPGRLQSKHLNQLVNQMVLFNTLLEIIMPEKTVIQAFLLLMVTFIEMHLGN